MLPLGGALPFSFYTASRPTMVEEHDIGCCARVIGIVRDAFVYIVYYATCTLVDLKDRVANENETKLEEIDLEAQDRRQPLPTPTRVNQKHEKRRADVTGGEKKTPKHDDVEKKPNPAAPKTSTTTTTTIGKKKEEKDQPNLDGITAIAHDKEGEKRAPSLALPVDDATPFKPAPRVTTIGSYGIGSGPIVDDVEEELDEHAKAEAARQKAKDLVRGPFEEAGLQNSPAENIFIEAVLDIQKMFPALQFHYFEPMQLFPAHFSLHFPEEAKGDKVCPLLKKHFEQTALGEPFMPLNNDYFVWGPIFTPISELGRVNVNLMGERFNKLRLLAE